MPFDSLTYDEPAVEQLPTFKPRRNQSRLDLRPAIWSLRNRPEEWEWQTADITLRHVPSQHVFWVGNGVPFCRLYEADCSCISRRSVGERPYWRDRFSFMRAYRAWRRAGFASEAINQQFAAHFLTPKRTDTAP